MRGALSDSSARVFEVFLIASLPAFRLPLLLWVSQKILWLPLEEGPRAQKPPSPGKEMRQAALLLRVLKKTGLVGCHECFCFVFGQLDWTSNEKNGEKQRHFLVPGTGSSRRRQNCALLARRVVRSLSLSLSLYGGLEAYELA